MARLVEILARAAWTSLPKIYSQLRQSDYEQEEKEFNIALQSGDVFTFRDNTPFYSWNTCSVKFRDDGCAVVNRETGQEYPPHEFEFRARPAYRPKSETDRWVRRKAEFEKPASKQPKGKGKQPSKTKKRRVGFAILKSLYPPDGIAPKGTEIWQIEAAVKAKWVEECKAQGELELAKQKPPTWNTIKAWQRLLRDQKRKKRPS